MLEPRVGRKQSRETLLTWDGMQQCTTIRHAVYRTANSLQLNSQVFLAAVYAK